MSNNKTRQVYTSEFKREAIELARTSGKPVTELAPRFSYDKSQLLLHTIFAKQYTNLAGTLTAKPKGRFSKVSTTKTRPRSLNCCGWGIGAAYLHTPFRR